MNRLIKLSVVSAMLLVASVFATSNTAQAGYGYGYGHGYRAHYNYGYRYYPRYYKVVVPVYNYGYCY